MSDIDENTKLFQKYLNDKAPRKLNKNCHTHPHVEGGLPPHLLKRQEEPYASSQSTPAASVDLPPWEGPQQVVVHDREFSPTPTSQERAPHVPAQQSRSSLHPALQRVLAQQARIRAERSPAVSADDARLAISRWERICNAQRMGPTQEIEQPSRHASDAHKQKWRPKNSSCWGSQSLPTSDASVEFVSNDAASNDANPSFGSDQSNGGAPFRDVRGSIADELDIVPKGDGTGWVNKHAWKDYHSPPGSDGDSSDDSFEKGWHYSFCRDWARTLSDPPLAFLLWDDDETPWECDIDTKDGTMMAPVDYPSTTVNPEDPGTPEELVRRMSSTAEIKVTMEAEKLRKRMKQREQREERRSKHHLGPEWKRVASSTSTPVDRPSISGRLHHGHKQAPDQTTKALVKSRQADPREPRIHCYLRPATRDDLPQILDIYNWEVEHGRQALDAKALTLRDIQRLFAECDAYGTPFIVAVGGTSPLVPTSRGEESALVRFRGHYQQIERSRPYGDSQVTLSSPSSSGKILGFGLVTLPSAGLAGHAHTSVSRFNGKLHLYVEPRSRRLGIGRCVLHRVLLCCSKRLMHADWYDWYDPHDSRACAEAGDNARNYARVFVEVASFKGDPDFSWRKKLLGEMNFLYVNTTDLTRKVIQDENGGWYDNTVWQHDCAGPGDVHESS